MEDGEKQSLEQIRALVEASEEVRFHSQDRGELYEWVNRTLRQQDYGRLKRRGKGLVRRYVAKMTGLSRAQAARLIRCYQGGGEVKPRVAMPAELTAPPTEWQAPFQALAEECGLPPDIATVFVRVRDFVDRTRVAREASTQHE